ncbi:MAG: competence/damage-inducible protein A [Myxococcota bacterium]
MKAAVLSIGTELTRGELVNTNATWLSEELTTLGYEVIEQAVIDDDRVRIVDALERLSKDVSLVVSTGGLGPTTDDLTAEAVAKACGVGLRRDEPTLARIRQRWASYGREMPSSNEKQADLPEGAEILLNEKGSAPGFGVALGETKVFCLPGVPREMKHLFYEAIVPRVGGEVRRTTYQVHVRSFGHTESQVGNLLQGLEEQHPGITIGYRASFPEIEVKVLARAEDALEAETQAKEVAEEVRRRLGDAVFGGRGDTFAGAVGDTLRIRGLTIALAESCTGGMVGSMITSVPGSSDYLLLDAVVYSNAAKTSILNVSEDILRCHGAVSSETAAAMADGALRVSGADIAVSITGVAGPTGGTEEKPVGTVWFGVAQKDEPTFTKHRRLPGDRQRIRTLASYVALRLINRAALGHGPSIPPPESE